MTAELVGADGVVRRDFKQAQVLPQELLSWTRQLDLGEAVPPALAEQVADRWRDHVMPIQQRVDPVLQRRPKPHQEQPLSNPASSIAATCEYRL